VLPATCPNTFLTMTETSPSTPPVCSYEGSDYQRTFWEAGERQYEDAVEAIALKRLLPQHGYLLLELGAGAAATRCAIAAMNA